MLTRAGREAALIDTPAPTNGHAVPWLKPLRVLTSNDLPGGGICLVRFG